MRMRMLTVRYPFGFVFVHCRTASRLENYAQGVITPKFNQDVKPTHIVVGGGSAGCVMANRLSENPNHRVLLLEAGPRDSWWYWTIHMPAALMYNLSRVKFNWMYYTTEQKQLDGRVLYWPRGRVWGGSSSLNAMCYVRGHPMDYDRWEAEGAKNWSYKYCLPYFKKSQKHELSLGASDPFRGHDGPLKVKQGQYSHPLHRAFIQAGEQSGIGYTADMNGFRQEGIGPMDMTIHNGTRFSASRAYLWPILDRPNLYTSSGITATKLLFDKRRCIGVEFVRNMTFFGMEKMDSWTREKVYCEDAVILAGGAINTPQLLMLSGIGPGRHIKSHLLSVLQEMPGVGSNLQDHLGIYVQQECKLPITLYNKSSWRFPHHMLRAGMQWILHKSGNGASSHLESGGFARSSAKVNHPDIQFHFLPSTVIDDGRSLGTCHAYQVHVGALRPKSRGRILLQSPFPFRHPTISPEYLSHPDDVVDFRNCIRISRYVNFVQETDCRQIFAQKAFDDFRGKELAPGDDCTTDDQLDTFVRARANSNYHPCGTCRMGPSNDPMTVVDPETMSVHGFEGLKIVDASVIPSIVSGNLNAPVMMIAERAADLICGKPTLPPESPEIWSPPQAKHTSQTTLK